MTLPARLLDSHRLRRRARGPRRRRLHPPRHPDRHAARRPGRARRRPRRLPEEPVGRLLAQVAAQLGPRIVASDRELAATRDIFSNLLRGRRRAPRRCRSTSRSCARTSAARRSRAARARSDPATSSRTARWPPGSAGPTRRAPSAARARPTRSRSSCRATACCPARAASAATAAGRTRKRRLLAHEGARRCALALLGDLDRLDHDRLDRLLVGPHRRDADRVDDVLALGDLAEQRVLGRQRRPSPVTTKNWLPEVPGSSICVLAIATTPLRRRGPRAAPRRSSSPARRCRRPSGRRPGSRSRARSGGSRGRRRSPCRRGA